MNRNRKIILIFLLSFSVRALLVIPVIKSDTRPKFDEQSYFRRAIAFCSILESLVHLRPPQAKERDVFYEKGARPPFQSIVLSLGMLLLGKGVTAARFIMIFLSSLTTVLIFLLTDRLAGPRAGLAASGLHLAYPSFLAFSHYLWSETTYIFLLFLSLHLAMMIPESQRPWKRTWLSIFVGVSLGCLALTRSAALLPMFIIPAWVFLRLKTNRAKLVSPIVIMIFLFLTILPWEYSLCSREKRFVMLSNLTYRNLYLGHNPWQKYANDDDDQTINNKIQKSLRDYMRSRSVAVERAASDLAIKEISSHFGTFISRCVEESLFLWTFDFFPLRHIVNAVYPPMSDRAVFLTILVFAGSAIFLYLLTIKGLMVKGSRLKNKVLILVLIIGGASPYVITYGNSRYNLPQIALLLPIAALGLANLKEKEKAYLPISVLTIIGLAFLFCRSYPDYIYQRLRPSSYYSGAVGSLDRVFGIHSLFGDKFFMKKTNPKYADTLTLTIVNEDGSDYSFDSHEPLKRIVIPMSPNRKRIHFAIFGQALRGPPELHIFSKKQDIGIELKPTDPAYWNRFKAIGLKGIQLSWKGGR